MGNSCCHKRRRAPSNEQQTSNTAHTTTGSMKQSNDIAESSGTMPGYVEGPLNAKDLAARIEAPKTAQKIRLGSYTITYAYVSQRGHYPEALNKPNQDSYICLPTFGKNGENAFFGVFDGHGRNGDLCSQYVKNLLPSKILSYVTSKDSPIHNGLLKAHLEVDQEMNSATLDDSMSGTTSISVLFTGEQIHVCNVGDSRAVLGQIEHDDRFAVTGKSPPIVARPLSVDQTPFRKDERERVKICGARIMTMDQIEGNEMIHEDWGTNLADEIDETGDPPRIWHPLYDYPGTAFTRSIGDRVSKSLGVCAEPEILSKVLTDKDKIVVIASDGVFEFLTSQMVISIASSFDDPLDACQALAQESYNRWLQHETRTDDITVICLFLEGNEKQKRDSVYIGTDMKILETMQRPVRSFINDDRETVAKLDDIDASLSDDETVSMSTEHMNSDEDIRKIKEFIKTNFLFKHLPENKLIDVLGRMTKKNVQQGEIIIKQGEQGDYFYVVEEGEYEVRMRKNPLGIEMSAERMVSATNSAADYGEVVHEYIAKQNIHPSFGDLALIYARPRAATVISRASGILWSLHRSVFRMVLSLQPSKDVARLLRKVEAFKCLTATEINHIAQQMSEVTYKTNDVIVDDDRQSCVFYLITKGSVSRKTDDSMIKLTVNDYFGEEIICSQSSKDATLSKHRVTALENTSCLVISHRDIETAVGSFYAILQKEKRRESRKNYLKKSRNDDKELPKFRKFYEESNIPEDQLSNLEATPTIMVAAIDSVDSVVLLSHTGFSRGHVTGRTTNKQEIVSKGSVQRLLDEHDVYCVLDDTFPTVPSVMATYNGKASVTYLYDEVIVGSFASFTKSKIHDEDFVRFYTIQLIGALQYLHLAGVICRSLSPSDIMVDMNGNLKLVNMRYSKYVGCGKTYTLCGPPEYMSPQQVVCCGYNFSSDYWSLGVLMYELLFGIPPFQDQAELETYKKISDYQKDTIEFPHEISIDAKNMINGLLDPSPLTRFGCDDMLHIHDKSYKSSLLQHSFFRGFKESRETTPLYNACQEGLQNIFSSSTSPCLASQDPFLGDNALFQDF